MKISERRCRLDTADAPYAEPPEKQTIDARDRAQCALVIIGANCLRKDQAHPVQVAVGVRMINECKWDEREMRPVERAAIVTMPRQQPSNGIRQIVHVREDGFPPALNDLRCAQQIQLPTKARCSLECSDEKVRTEDRSRCGCTLSDEALLCITLTGLKLGM